MAGITLEKGKKIYESGQPMTALHLITAGKVQVEYPGGTYTLNKGDVAGVCEICSEVHFLSYTALEDTSILTYPINNLEALAHLLKKHPDVARLFLLSLFRQINTLQSQCSISEMNCSNLYHVLTEDYERYTMLCSRYRIAPRSLADLDESNAYLNDEAPDFWLNGYYTGLAHLYAADSYKSLVQESSVSMGMLRKGSLDFRKTHLSLDEQFRYTQQISEFYFNSSGNDLFDFYTALYYKMTPGSEDADEVITVIDRMIQQFEHATGLDEQQFGNRIHAFRSSITNSSATAATDKEETIDASVLSELTGSLNVILEFAKAEPEFTASFRQHISIYRDLEDRSSLEEDVAKLRRSLTTEFYTLYTRVFQQTLEQPSVPMPVWMFLYFGHVDEELTGLSNAATLYSIAQSMSDTSSSGVYTFYDWLMAIYTGKKEPSRNEFDQDYSDHLHKQKAAGNITEAEMRNLESDSMSKVSFELENMFPQVNKITFGRVTTFCPIFSSDNVLKDLMASCVTVTKVCKAIEQIRQIDYSAFYRESLDMEHIDTMGKEPIHLEYLPDVILMPNAGIRGAMWQEIEGKRRNSPSRMIFSIFHLEDLMTTFIRLTGEFRWELCKRVQGARWNDVSERSLTSEYFDYVQFYRKNHDLTPEAKEKIRASLQRAKNSFKEMFVRDYIIWILFEGTGSPRMNKVARRILFTHCPFPADICETMMQNPLYSDILNRHRIVTAQKLHHLNLLATKFKNSRIPIPETLENECLYVQGKPVN